MADYNTTVTLASSLPNDTGLGLGLGSVGGRRAARAGLGHARCVSAARSGLPSRPAALASTANLPPEASLLPARLGNAPTCPVFLCPGGPQDPLSEFGDLFGGRRLLQADPFAGDPFGGGAGGASPMPADPFGGGSPSAAGSSPDPFASSGSGGADPFGGGGGGGSGIDPFASDPFAASNSTGGGNGTGPVDVGAWDLGGGWWSGMGGGEGRRLTWGDGAG